MNITVNGELASLDDAGPHTSALDWLRSHGLTGCKEGCAEGECGACAVLVIRPDGDASTWTALNACLVPVLALDGQEVVTAEGLGTPGSLHPVQQEMACRGGSQCGYCTPGFVCSMAAEYYRGDRSAAAVPNHRGTRADGPEHIGPEHIAAAPDHLVGANGFDLEALSGNLCRCTGYRPIRDAAFALGAPTHEDAFAARLDRPAPNPVATRAGGEHGEFIRPASLADALSLLAADPEAHVVAGCTDWGVEVNLRGSRARRVVAIDRLPELRTLTVDDAGYQIGAALTLSEIEHRLDGAIPLLAELFPQFASRLIRNGATIGGNIGTASPIGDTPPALLALDAQVVLASSAGEREVALADYFTGYRRSVRRPDELIKAIRIPTPLATLTAFHKIAKRRFDDISSVAIGFALDVDDGLVRRARIGLGGVAATPIRALDAEAALEGRPWNQDTVDQAAELLGAAGTPLDDHRASARYRTAMLGTALHKFFANTTAIEGVGA